MKARKVKGLHPDMPLADAAERIVRVRLDELHSFMPRALDPDEVEALHDLRIAAKRLRYLLEVTSFCFGSYAATATKRARDVQDLVGEIHDCDVQRPEVLKLIGQLREHDAAALRRAGGDAEDLDSALVTRAPYRSAYRGLEVLAAHLQARRELLFDRFLALWEKLERQGFRRKLEKALSERAPEPDEEPAEEQGGNGRGAPFPDDSLADALRSAVGGP